MIVAKQRGRLSAFLFALFLYALSAAVYAADGSAVPPDVQEAEEGTDMPAGKEDAGAEDAGQESPAQESPAVKEADLADTGIHKELEGSEEALYGQEEVEEEEDRKTEELEEEIREKREAIRNAYFQGSQRRKMARSGLPPGKMLELAEAGEIFYEGYSTNHFIIQGNIAYCLEPSQPTPANGRYEAVGLAGDSDLAKVMYYSCGAPGEADLNQHWGNEGFWQIPDAYAAGVMPWEDRYAYCHMFQAWVYSGYDFQVAFYGTALERKAWYGQLESDFNWKLEHIINELPPVPAGFEAYIVNTGGGSQVMSAWLHVPNGEILLKKASASPDITDGNSCYSLAGAVYGLYQGDSLVQEAATAADGTARFTEVPPGSYTLREITPPRGFAIDKKTYGITVSSDQTAEKEVKDYPQNGPVQVLLRKTDAETKKNVPQKNASLADARFTVRYYAGHYAEDPAQQGVKPARAWVMRTDEKGEIKLDDAHKVSGDGFYRNSAGEAALPLGTITMQETKAPAGYLLNPHVFVRQINSEGSEETVRAYNMPTVPETPQKGQIVLQKTDAQTGKKKAQGAASLENAVYDIFRKADYKAGDTRKAASFAGSMTTDKEGRASSAELPLDTYYVLEREASRGYLLEEKIHEVVLSAKNLTDRVFVENVASREQVKRGDIQLAKFASDLDGEDERDRKKPLGGIRFSVKSVATGEVVCTMITDENGFATTADAASPQGRLPYDTYVISEENAPRGLAPVKPFSVKVEEHGVTLGYILEDRYIASAVSVAKRDKETEKIVPMAGTEFRLLDKEKKPITMTLRYPRSKKQETFLTDEKGSFVFPEKLAAGTYYLEEVSAPKGMLKGEAFLFEVDSDSSWEEPLIVESFNENVMGEIALRKTDADTEAPVEGAVYGLYAAEDIFTADGTLRVKKESLVAEKATGADGKIWFQELHLGRYYVKEKKPAPGYVLDEKKHEAVLAYKDQDTALIKEQKEVQDVPVKVRIVKIDQETEEPLEGVGFRMWSEPEEEEKKGEEESGESDGQMLYTDEKGEIRLSYLEPGAYCIQEVSPLPGYTGDDAIRRFIIDENGMFHAEEDAASYKKGEIIIENEKVPPEEGGPEEEPPAAARTGDGGAPHLCIAFAGICISTAAGALALYVRRRSAGRQKRLG